MDPILCPWCNEYVFIEQLNCGIFRHATFINGGYVNPHASEEECNSWVKNGQIMGCGKPFQIVNGEVKKCEYI